MLNFAATFGGQSWHRIRLIDTTPFVKTLRLPRRVLTYQKSDFQNKNFQNNKMYNEAAVKRNKKFACYSLKNTQKQVQFEAK